MTSIEEVTSKANMINQDIKKGKEQISLCNVAVNWQHTEQPSPAFKRLMSLLLQKGKERKKEVNDD
ncbi:hypothetical protein ACFLY3_01770 [Chloroflexota bacterium]